MRARLPRVFGPFLVALALLALTVAPAQSDTGGQLPSAATRASEVPARQLPAAFTATSFWTVDRVRAAKDLDVAYDQTDGSYTVGANTSFANRNNARILVVDGSKTLSALWPGANQLRNATGKVLFSIGSNYYVCTGVVVTDTTTGRSIVATAAHCVYDQGSGQFAQNWVFVPDFTDSSVSLNTNYSSFCPHTTYGCWQSNTFVVSHYFTNDGVFTITSSHHDFAFAAVGAGGLNGTTQLDSVVGSIPVSTHATVSAPTWVLGYPSARPYSGSALIYSSGPLGTDPQNSNSTYSMGSMMGHGSSGGPWVQGVDSGNPVLISLTSYGYTDDPNLQGSEFTSETLGMLSVAQTTTGNVRY